MDADGNFQEGSLRDLEPRAAEFSIVTQDLSVQFDEDDDQEVRAGESIELQYSSPVRPSGYNVNVTEANEDIDPEELNATFQSLVDAGVVDSIDEHPNEDRIMLMGVDSSFDEDVTFSEDIDPGEYELEFEVVDTTAEDTAAITVLEEVDADADFTQGTYVENRGDIVAISGTVEGNTDTVSMTIGDIDDDGYEANVTVEANDDDEFTVLFNTRNAGQQTVAGGSNYPQDIDDMDGNIFGTAEDQGEIQSATQMENDIASILVAGNYDIRLQRENPVRDDLGEYDIATLDLQERSTDSINLWRAPSDVDADDIEDLDDLSEAIENGEATETNTVSVTDDGSGNSADLLIHEISASGVLGNGNGAEELLNNTGNVTLEYEQVSQAGNRDALELNYTETNWGNMNVLVDRENDVIYAIVNTNDLQVSRGADALQTLPADEDFEVRYNVSANYLNEFLRDGDLDPSDEEDNEIVSSDLSVVDRELTFETLDGEVVVPPTEDAEISGTTTVAPGTEMDVRAQGSGDNAFLRTSEDVVVNEDGSFAATIDMSEIEVDTEFEASVRNQGFEDNAETDGVVQESEGPVFAVSDLSPAEAEAMQGDTITVSATITNDGDSSGTQTVALTIDGNEVATQEVELDAGGETTVEFADVDTSELEEGDHEHAIQTDDDSASGTLTITVEDGGDDGAADDGSSDDGASDDGSADDSSADDSSGDDGAADDGETEDQPGFGAVIALIALLGAALLAARRNN